MEKRKTRPVYLNLFQIRMPVAAIVSIFHRLSGLLLFLFIPFLIYILEESLKSIDHFNNVILLFQATSVRIFFIVLLWASIHHFFAGIRFLLIDIDLGITKKSAHFSAWLVNIGALICTLIVIWVLK